MPKSLPAHLFYDAVGSKLYERISELPEYYLTRAEQEILETHADDVAARAADRGPRALTVVELGAGSATKTEALLRAVLRHQRLCEYVPIDVSHDALLRAEQRLRERLGTPEEIAQIIVFLASDRSSFVSGHILSADGGKVAR